MRKIKEFFERKDYQNIINLYEEEIMMNNNIKFSDMNSESIYAIVFSLLYYNKYDDIDFMNIRLKKEKVFDYSYGFLFLCAFLKQADIHKAISYIVSIDVFQSEEVLMIMGEDESSFRNILKHDDVNKIPCLLLVALISSLSRIETYSIDDIMINYFEMLDIVYQSGCDMQITDYMMNITKVLFMSNN